MKTRPTAQSGDESRDKSLPAGSQPYLSYENYESELLSAIMVFDGVQRFESSGERERQSMMDMALISLQRMSNNFLDDEVSHCFMFGAVTLLLLQSVASYIRQEVDGIREGDPKPTAASSNPGNSQTAVDGTYWRALYTR